MKRTFRWLLPAVTLAGLAAAAPLAHANLAPEAARKLYGDVTPSLVAVQYAYVNELGRQEFIAPGVIVGEDLVMTPMTVVFSAQVPDEQMKDFKVIVPSQEHDPDEIDAVFQGRDERTNMAFIKPKEGQHWKPIKFEDLPVQVGDPVASVGILPQGAAYKSYLMEAQVAATLRGDVPQVLVQGGGLAALGAPVFNGDGKAIGIVGFFGGQPMLLNNGADATQSINTPPKFFVPASDFLLSLSDPPTPQKPIDLPWLGLPELTGLSKDVSEALNLKGQPAIQVGDVLADSPAAKAGIKQGDIILKFNGKPLERGDEASELPGIFRRRMLRNKVGEEVTFTVLREQDQPPKEIKVTLGEQPKRANLAKRFYADDLGFVVRELVFLDTYQRKLPADTKGVLVDLERPQSNAVSAGIHRGDIVIRMNNEPVTDLDAFSKQYKQLRKDKPHEPIVLVVQRKDREDTIRIEPPQ